jgi:octaprenyl-diphosphate synthase
LDIIRQIHNFLSEDLNNMNHQIINNLTAEEALVGIISNHLTKAGGKRIRPVLTILSTRLFQDDTSKTIPLATAVEFIHMATLLHDDVVDGSKMRRYLPTANTIWGNKASILVGDFLFSQSFKLIVSTGSLKCLSVLSSASAIIAEGEVSQLARLEEKRFLDENSKCQNSRIICVRVPSGNHHCRAN